MIQACDYSTMTREQLIERLRATEQAASDKTETESHFRQMIESIPGMVFTTRADGYCDYQSRQWEIFTGVPASDQLGDNWNKLLHPEDQQRAMDAWTEAVLQRSPYDLEYRVRKYDKSYQWFRVVGQPICDNQGRIVRWFGVLLNIDSLKRTTDALAERKTQLRTITDNIHENIIMIGRDHRTLFLNSSALELVRRALWQPQLAMDDILGKDPWMFFPDNKTAKLAMIADERVMSRGSTRITEDKITTSDGKCFFLTSRVPLRNDSGQIIGLIIIGRDITTLKTAEARRLAALERQRDTLVREVHHRIKNHLQGVIGLLRNSAVDSPESAPILESTSARILSIAQVYGLQGNRGDSQILLNQLIAALINSTYSPIAVNFQTTSDADYLLSQQDAVPVSLIINELLSNAIKHLTSPEPDRPVQIRVSEMSSSEVCVRIVSGPALLPTGFDFNSEQELGIGLELVKALLPSKGEKLMYRQLDDDVEATFSFRMTKVVDQP